MSNRDLLKEAIADAKAVKEMAITNAKAALEEAFAPQLNSLLAKKLQEMEDEDEKKDMHTEEMHDDEHMSEEELNELLAELEAEDSEEPIKEAEEEESEEEEEEEEEKEEEFDLEDMSEEDLKAFIEEVVDEMIAAGELEAGHEGMENETPEEETEMSDEESEEEPMMENKETVNEVVGTAALLVGGLAALAGGAIAKAYKSFKDEQKQATEKMTAQLIAKGTDPEQAVKQAVEKVGASMSAAPGSGKYAGGKGGFNPGSSLEEAEALEESTPEIVQQGMEMLKSAGITNAHTAQMVLAGLGAAGAVGGAALMSKVKDFVANFKKGKAKVAEVEEADEMKEALETIATLKAELSEVNLLNAKLLYTNKIFKGKNLTEAQKVKVLSTFDKAESVKEVKLVYETLSEGLRTATTKQPIKESKSFASKAVGVSTKKPVVETDNMVNRFQKLAGIK